MIVLKTGDYAMNLKGVPEVTVVEGQDKYATTCSTGPLKFQRVEKHEAFKISGNDLKQCKDKTIKTANGVRIQNMPNLCAAP